MPLGSSLAVVLYEKRDHWFQDTVKCERPGSVPDPMLMCLVEILLSISWPMIGGFQRSTWQFFVNFCLKIPCKQAGLMRCAMFFEREQRRSRSLYL